MEMFGLILHIVAIVCLRFEVRGEMTANIVYSLLSDRFDQLASVTYTLKSELRSSVAAINDRIDNIEQISKSPLHSNSYSTEVQGKRNEMVDPENKNPNDRILKALAAEKIYVNNVLTDYEKKLIKFQRGVSDQMNVMNTTIEASREKMGRKLEENTGNINKSVHQLMTHSETKLIEFQRAVRDKMNVMNTTIKASRKKLGRKIKENTGNINKSVHQLMTHSETKLIEFQRAVSDQMNVMYTTIETMGRKLEENTGNINKSVHQLMTHSETKFQDVIKEFETVMNTASIEHETTRTDLNEIQTTVKDIEDDLKYLDCSGIKLHEPNAQDGVYDVVLWRTNRTIQVYCDMTTDDGGWTVFQNRYDGSVDFYRNYSQYVQGFGDLHTEFWLGLDYIQEMTSQTENDLRIDLMLADGTTAYEVLRSFSLSSTGYVLNVGNPVSSENFGSSLRFGPYHSGSAFSTYDHDVDSVSVNCATEYHGAWWYRGCYHANLNGQYLTPGTEDGTGMMYWSFSSKKYQSMKRSRMSFRRQRT